jgi:hypothetical protein
VALHLSLPLWAGAIPIQYHHRHGSVRATQRLWIAAERRTSRDVTVDSCCFRNVCGPQIASCHRDPEVSAQCVAAVRLGIERIPRCRMQMWDAMAVGCKSFWACQSSHALGLLCNGAGDGSNGTPIRLVYEVPSSSAACAETRRTDVLGRR